MDLCTKDRPSNLDLSHLLREERQEYKGIVTTDKSPFTNNSLILVHPGTRPL